MASSRFHKTKKLLVCCMLAGDTVVLFRDASGPGSREPLGCMGVWRLQAGSGSMGSPADWAVAWNSRLQ